MLCYATLMYKTQNMQTKEDGMGKSTCPSKYKIIGVLKALLSIQYPIYHLRKM